MLKIGGYINILFAIGHVIGLIWADQIFTVTGIGKEMAELSEVHWILPYLMTVIVSIVFFIFSLHALSALGKFKRLPFLELGVFSIVAIYIFRGIGELVFDFINNTNSFGNILFSI